MHDNIRMMLLYIMLCLVRWSCSRASSGRQSSANDPLLAPRCSVSIVVDDRPSICIVLHIMPMTDVAV